MAEPIALEAHELPDVIVLRVKGEVDLSTAPTLRNALRSALASRRHVVMSIRELQYMDMAAFHALEAGRNAVTGTQRVVLVASPPHLKRIIQIIQFDKVLPIFESEAEALAFVRDGNTP